MARLRFSRCIEIHSVASDGPTWATPAMVRRDRDGAGLAGASVAALDGQLEPMVMNNTQDDSRTRPLSASGSAAMATADARRTLPAFFRRDQAVGSSCPGFSAWIRIVLPIVASVPGAELVGDEIA